jgi:hypothetical protein
MTRRFRTVATSLTGIFEFQNPMHESPLCSFFSRCPHFPKLDAPWGHLYHFAHPFGVGVKEGVAQQAADIDGGLWGGNIVVHETVGRMTVAALVIALIARMKRFSTSVKGAQEMFIKPPRLPKADSHFVNMNSPSAQVVVDGIVK